MFCTQCGSSVAEGHYFCEQCGAKVEIETSKSNSVAPRNNLSNPSMDETILLSDNQKSSRHKVILENSEEETQILKNPIANTDEVKNSEHSVETQAPIEVTNNSANRKIILNNTEEKQDHPITDNQAFKTPNQFESSAVTVVPAVNNTEVQNPYERVMEEVNKPSGRKIILTADDKPEQSESNKIVITPVIVNSTPAPKIEQPVSKFASGLPEWDLVPPQLVVRRVKRVK